MCSMGYLRRTERSRKGGVQDRCAEKLSDAVKPKDCGSVGIPFVIFDATKDTMR